MAVMNEWMRGKCWDMAIALHENTGLPLHGLFDECGLCHHAFVLDEGMGKGIDARGLMFVDSLKRGCAGQEVRPLAREAIEADDGFLGRKLDKTEIESAWRYACKMRLVETWKDTKEKHDQEVEGLRMAAWEAALGSQGASGLKDRIAEGMDVNAITKNGHLPLARAAQCAGPQACTTLIEAGAVVNAHGEHCHTPLHLALAYHQYETVKVLLHHGADTSYMPPNPSQDYLTPFQMMVSACRLDEVRLFVEMYSQDLAQKTVQGKTLIQLAEKDVEMRALLRSLKTEMAVADAVTANVSSQPTEARARGLTPL